MVRLLHTSDWHVGKTIRGRSRADEHRAVLGEIAGIAEANEVDVVIVAGDLFETAAPGPESEEIVYRALVDLARTGAEVVLIAGNHDHAGRLRAVVPMLEIGHVHVVATPVRPDEGGVRTLACRSGGELDVAMLPFVSQRGIVRAQDLMDHEAFEAAQKYSARLALLIQMLADRFVPERPSVLVAHGFVLGGQTGGGERSAHLIEEYQIPPLSFPTTCGYVALGHLHRAHKIAGATAIHYCGSPMQLDFGEVATTKQVNVVDLAPGVPAKVVDVVLTSGRQLLTLTGSVDELRAQASEIDQSAYLRVRVSEPRRPGLGDEVREVLGEGVVDVIVDDSQGRVATPTRAVREGRTPAQLFAEFLGNRTIEDPRLGALFDELHDEIVTAGEGSD